MWQVENLLDAPTYAGEFEPHTLSIEVEDKPGVLNQARSLPPEQCAHAHAHAGAKKMLMWRLQKKVTDHVHMQVQVPGNVEAAA